MADKPARVLVVEDDPGISGALELALGTAGYEVRVAPNAAEAEQASRTFLPDLGVIDIRLPGGVDGVTLARRLRASGDLVFMFLTAADGIEDRVAGFEAGADDYLAKPFAMQELLLRVRALLRRCGRLESAVHQVGALVIDEGAHLVVWADAVVELTPLEFELLAVLARSPGQVLSKAQLLDEVWGFEDYDVNIVEVHVSSLRRKLEEHGPRVIHTVRGVGYVARP